MTDTYPPPPPNYCPFWYILIEGFVRCVFALDSAPWCYRISLFTCQILGPKIFKLDVPLLLLLCRVLQNSLQELNLDRQLCLLIQEGLDLVLRYLFVIKQRLKTKGKVLNQKNQKKDKEGRFLDKHIQCQKQLKTQEYKISW